MRINETGSHRESLSWEDERIVDVKVDARTAFGTYAQVHTFAEPVHSMALRTEATGGADIISIYGGMKKNCM